MIFGWLDSPAAVEVVKAALPMPMVGSNAPQLQENKDVYLYDIHRKVVGKDAPSGPQGIGDCVSWAFGNLDNYVQAIQIHQQLAQANLLSVLDKNLFTEAEFNQLKAAQDNILFQYEEAATEPIYALSRVEVGGQRGSMQDGSVGAWGAKALERFGSLSRPHLKRLGLSPDYDKNRAKQWGAYGLPDNLEPEAVKQRFKTISIVKTFKEAAALIQSGYPVAVCSNRGFTMTRDQDGFCRPEGQWMHAMLFVGVRWDRPGLCLAQSWGKNTPNGPLALGQPDNTFWVDANVCDYMLGQGDSWTASDKNGYPARDLLTWKH